MLQLAEKGWWPTHSVLLGSWCSLFLVALFLHEVYIYSPSIALSVYHHLYFIYLLIVLHSVDDIKKWWIWGYWASPLMYAQNSVAVNEFLGHSWKKVGTHSFMIIYLSEPYDFRLKNSFMFSPSGECHNKWSFAISRSESVGESWYIPTSKMVLDWNCWINWICSCFQCSMYSRS